VRREEVEEDVCSVQREGYDTFGLVVISSLRYTQDFYAFKRVHIDHRYEMVSHGYFRMQ